MNLKQQLSVLLDPKRTQYLQYIIIKLLIRLNLNFSHLNEHLNVFIRAYNLIINRMIRHF